MNNNPLISIIPSAKLAAVSDALEITFGNSSVEDFEHLNNGYSGAQVYKVTVNGGFYLDFRNDLS
jgi:hypothetical protein